MLHFKIFIKGDSLNFVPHDLSDLDAKLAIDFVYKRIQYNCIHFGSVGKDQRKDGTRPNTHTMKIGCKCRFRLN